MSLLLLPSYFSSSELRNFGSLSLSAKGGKNAGFEERWIFMEQNIPSLSLSFFSSVFRAYQISSLSGIFCAVCCVANWGWLMTTKDFFPSCRCCFFWSTEMDRLEWLFLCQQKPFLLVDDGLLFSQIVVHKYQRLCPSCHCVTKKSEFNAPMPFSRVNLDRKKSAFESGADGETEKIDHPSSFPSSNRSGRINYHFTLPPSHFTHSDICSQRMEASFIKSFTKAVSCIAQLDARTVLASHAHGVF